MEQKTERRFFNGSTAQITRNDDGEAKHISGTGIVFYNADEPGTEYQLWENVFERLDSSAIDRALAEGDDVRGLFNHDSNMLLGRTSAGTMILEKTTTTKLIPRLAAKNNFRLTFQCFDTINSCHTSHNFA